MTAPNDEWETVDVPKGTFIGWSDRPGQVITGDVLGYTETGGEDFAGKPCPQLELELTEAGYSVNKDGQRYDHAPGDQVNVTAGLANLKRAVRAAHLSVGDRVRIGFTDTERTPKGTVKLFEIRVRRGAGEQPPF